MMYVLSKIRQAAFCLKPGKVTLDYPFQPRETPEGFRGRPTWDMNRCVGCAGCANNCPSRCILIRDLCQEFRVLRHAGERCVYCGRCAEVCPEDAITMTPEFELATNAKNDLDETLQLFMATCQRCGECFEPPTSLERLKYRGYRWDDVEGSRMVIPESSHRFELVRLRENANYERPTVLKNADDAEGESQ
jgi:hydrogenase-4 component H